MKKTLISVLLIVSLLSTALFSVVFAAYSDSKTATGTATVSAFNVTITTVNHTAQDGGIVNLTPATTNAELASVTVTGTPNVKVRITYDAVLTIDEEDWTIDTNGAEADGEEVYFPIEFKIGANTIAWGSSLTTGDTDSDGKISTIAELKAAVEAAIEGAAPTEVGANIPLDGNHDRSVLLTWSTSSNSTKNNLLTSDATLGLSIQATIDQVTE